VYTIIYGIAISIDSAAVSYALQIVLDWATNLLWDAVKACVGLCVPTDIAWAASCVLWWATAAIAWGFLYGGVAIPLALIMVVEAALGSHSLYGLKNGLEEAFAGIDPNGSVSSTSCGDAEDLLIVQFSAVPYPGDVSAQSTQNHPSVSSGLVHTTYQPVTSYATASYEGGNVGTMDASYDSSLTSAN
jgi:hypothetical protein